MEKQAYSLEEQALFMSKKPRHPPKTCLLGNIFVFKCFEYLLFILYHSVASSAQVPHWGVSLS